MQLQHFMNPLKGKPHTTEQRDRSGKPRFKIVCRELTPLRARLAYALDEWIGLSVIGICGYAWLNMAHPVLLDIGLLAGFGAAAYFGLRGAVRIVLAVRTEIEMSAQGISVRRWLAWRRYDRLLEHRFALGLHDGAAEEARRMQYQAEQAGRKGKLLKQRPFYGESYKVVLLYGGHRIDLLNVYGEREASAIVARLTYIDRVLNETIAMTGGISKKPQDDWADAPGGFAHE